MSLQTRLEAFIAAVGADIKERVTLSSAQVITGTKTFPPGALLMRDAGGTITAEPYSDVNAPQTLTMTEFASAVPTPAAGTIVLYSPDGTAIMMKDDTGTVRTIGPNAGGVGTKTSALSAATTLVDTDTFPLVSGGATTKATLTQLTNYIEARGRQHNASVANQTTISGNSDVYLIGSDVNIPNGRVQAKTKYWCKFNVTKTAAGTAAPALTMRIGTAGSTADAARGVMNFPSQTGAIDTGTFEIQGVFRTVGSGTTAVLQSVGQLSHQLSITGLSTGVSPMVTVTSGGFDSTVSNLKIGISVNAGASSAWTVTLVDSMLSNLA